ncbi:MAG: DUF4339 domain-containing protein [Candidatus Protochlamydia sp.]|nr:DUF4339 domain-containing protein [Candidatus Protochlamydia sp.]
MPPHEMTTTQLIISFFILLIIATLTAYYADRKGRSFTIWFILGVLLGVFAPLILFFLSSNNGVNENNNLPAMTVSKPDPSLQPTSSPPPLELKETEDKLWYYMDKDHQQMGPVSVVALRDLWNRGLLEHTSYVWTQGMSDWLKVEQLPELKAALTKENMNLS